MSIQSLPLEILTFCFSYLPDQDVISTAVVCRIWRDHADARFRPLLIERKYPDYVATKFRELDLPIGHLPLCALRHNNAKDSIMYMRPEAVAQAVMRFSSACFEHGVIVRYFRNGPEGREENVMGAFYGYSDKFGYAGWQGVHRQWTGYTPIGIRSFPDFYELLAGQDPDFFLAQG